MPLSWNEIKERALAFSKEWEDECSEHAEAKSFWDGFFNIFGVPRRRVASFEQHVKKLDGKDGYIDLLWRGMILIEHKSRGRDLDRAYQQAKGYFPGIKDRDLPRYILTSDFAHFHLYDLETGEEHAFTLDQLYKNTRLFGFMAGYQRQTLKPEDPANIKAAELMGKLHDQFKATGYQGHPLELYLVRLLFCLFAEDTSIFERCQFQEYIEQKTAEDGSDLAYHIMALFHVLNTPDGQRLSNRDQHLTAFPYVNGGLFAETLPPAAFDTTMRQTLLDCCALDWSLISPAIFGSLFQSVMDDKARRDEGAHYTSEANILKLIKPLFLDDLWAEFHRIAALKRNDKPLISFHQRLAALKFFDPACGCGNFLVIAYRELRLLELAILRTLHSKNRTGFLSIREIVWLDVDQFYGIEIADFPAQIAQVALWMTDHQMNMQVSEAFGQYFRRLPLTKTPHIICANALQCHWTEVAADADYILGNPPFVGKTYQSSEQKRDLATVFHGVKSAKLLDFVACWYRKAADYLTAHPTTECAFVSTNSITQGEQVAVLWQGLLADGIRINFAHRTFAWTSEAKGKAAVHCVIIGFALHDAAQKTLFIYDDLKGEPHATAANTINPYLVDAAAVVVQGRSKPLCQVPEMVNGSKPTDGGNLILSDDEKATLLASEPQAAAWIRPLVGSREFINGLSRWCLWLQGINPADLRAMPMVLQRINAVKQMRQESRDAQTQKDAATPMLFQKIRQPEGDYLIVPRVSSEKRQFVPIGFMVTNVICSEVNQTIPNATLYHFAILTSTMHNAWMRAVAGRLKSDYRYSAKLVYNTFPWPTATDKQQQTIEAAAQAILDARALYPESSLADLYHPLTMPPELTHAHQALDRAVDTAYGKKQFTNEAQRVALLFDRYQTLTLKLTSIAH